MCKDTTKTVDLEEKLRIRQKQCKMMINKIKRLHLHCDKCQTKMEESKVEFESRLKKEEAELEERRQLHKKNQAQHRHLLKRVQYRTWSGIFLWTPNT